MQNLPHDNVLCVRCQFYVIQHPQITNSLGFAKGEYFPGQPSFSEITITQSWLFLSTTHFLLCDIDFKFGES